MTASHASTAAYGWLSRTVIQMVPQQQPLVCVRFLPGPYPGWPFLSLSLAGSVRLNPGFLSMLALWLSRTVFGMVQSAVWSNSNTGIGLRDIGRARVAWRAIDPLFEVTR